MATDPADDTGIQSHHYLRIALALIVVALFVAIGVEIAASGGTWLPSISAFFYTPAHDVFVASLIAASVALAALAGRGIETVFLDIAAVFAPLVALVPTGISAATLGSITGRAEAAVTSPCDGNGNCLPAGYLGAIDNGVVTYMIVVVAVVIVAVAIRAKMLTRTWGDGRHARQLLTAFAAPVIGLLAVAGIGILAFASPVDTGFPFNGPFGLSVHLTATLLFFALFTAVPVTNAIRWIGGRRRGRAPYRTGYAVVYIAVPLLMLTDLVVLLGIVQAGTAGPGVFACEAIALALFAIFWVVQTIQRWPEPNPDYLRSAVRSGQTRS